MYIKNCLSTWPNCFVLRTKRMLYQQGEPQKVFEDQPIVFIWSIWQQNQPSTCQTSALGRFFPLKLGLVFNYTVSFTASTFTSQQLQVEHQYSGSLEVARENLYFFLQCYSLLGIIYICIIFAPNLLWDEISFMMRSNIMTYSLFFLQHPSHQPFHAGLSTVF